MDENDDEYESKFIADINCISQVEIKEEVIIPENVSDGESTLSDNEKNPDSKLQDCIICRKYRSMFIILRNHDCQTSEGKCKSCAEISHWSNCFKSHKESHQSDKEADYSSDSTASDREGEEGTCGVCKKYEFMVHLLKNHICQYNSDKKCKDCAEVLHWMSCYNNHLQSHKTELVKVKEENSSDSTVTDNEEIRKLLSPSDEKECGKCLVCLKYQGTLIILEENHLCDIKNSNENCEKCTEIIHWYKCLEKHKRTHEDVGEHSLVFHEKSYSTPTRSRKVDCGICLKLNAIVTKLVKNHRCVDKKSCVVCQEVSYWLSCLKSHKQSERVSELSDGEEQEAVKRLGHQKNCEICLKFQATIVSLSHHMCQAKTESEKCDVCLEVSLWYKNFRLHEKHHGRQFSGHKNFISCTCCGKRFTGEKMLRVHKSYCKSSYFACDICHKKFVNMFLLKQHKILKLCSKSLISSKYICKTCKKTFSNPSDLKTHEDVHDLKIYNSTENGKLKSF